MENDEKSIGKNKTILIAEDETDFAEVLKMQLSEYGFKTVSSGRATEVISKAKNQKFDCILLDLKLENGNGERIIEVIRTDPSAFNFKTPIIMISGHLNAGVLTRIGKHLSGAFVKPFDPQTLVERIKIVCQ